MVTNKDLSRESYCYGCLCFNSTILVRSRCSLVLFSDTAGSCLRKKLLKKKNYTKTKTPLHPTAGRWRQYLDGDENERFSN